SLDRLGGLRPIFAPHAAYVIQELAVELHLLGIHRNRLQAEMLDQLAQRIGADHRVIIDFGNAGFIHRGGRIEFAREDLAAEPVARLENGDATKLAEFALQVPSAHEPAWAAAYDCKIKHDDSVIPAPSPEVPL